MFLVGNWIPEETAEEENKTNSNDDLKLKLVKTHCSTQYPGGGFRSISEGWSWVGLGIRGWSWVGLGQGCPTLFMLIDCPAQFISNPNQTHLP